MKIGIRGHDLPNAPFDTADQMIESLKLVGIDSLQLVYKKGFKNFNLDPLFLLELADKFKNNNITVGMIGAYFNMIHPNEEKYEDGLIYFKWCLESAFVFNCKLVGSETGSANGDKWTFNEYNHTEEAFERVVKTVDEINRYGREFKTRPIIEGAYAHTVYTPELLKELVDRVELEDVTVDVFNYLHIGNYKEANDIFDRCLKLFGNKIKVFHVKDFNVSDGKLVQCAIGDGIMDWKYFIPKIKEVAPDAFLILEGVTGEENIKKSVNYIKELINE